MSDLPVIEQAAREVLVRMRDLSRAKRCWAGMDTVELPDNLEAAKFLVRALDTAGLLATDDDVLAERDAAEEWADKISAAFVPDDVLGEHSNVNNPWQNAVDYANSKRRQGLEILGATGQGETHYVGDDCPGGHHSPRGLDVEGSE